MNFNISNVKETEQRENLAVIELCVNACAGVNTLDEAFTGIAAELEKIVFWSCGQGSSHIWVSNSRNERLLLITEG